MSPDGGSNSTIFSAISQTGKGQGGDIRIATKSFSVTNGARLNVSTSGQSDAGNLTINARDSVLLDGVGSNGFSSGLFASTINEGQGGKEERSQ
ncbi:hypothetical protein [Scytonema sp. NUACC26]|uniref:hypothetical protein n=1 Tax=Scytonema sp. NUACC26 TaxID=3140176 RepID=UPI0034DC28BA